MILLLLGGSLLLSGCRSASVEENPPPTEAAEPAPPPSTAAVEVENQAEQEESEDSTAEPEELAAPQEGTGLSEGVYFLELESRSSNSILENLVLEVRTAQIMGETLLVSVAFYNIGDEPLSLVGARLSPRRQTIVDGDGTTYEAVDVSESIRLLSDPDRQGIPPGGAILGDIAFNRPAIASSFTFNIAAELEYEPLNVALTDPAANPEPLVSAPEGRYPVAQNLYSFNENLRTIELQVEAVSVTADKLIFDVAFANTGRQGFSLFGRLSGANSWLIAGDKSYARPTMVSPELAEDIQPQDGWAPGAASRGQIHFARPQDMSAVRFGFETFVPLTLQFDGRGLVLADITSATGGPPEPPLPPSPADVTFAELNELLAAEAARYMAEEAPSFIDSAAFELAPSAVIGESALENGELTDLNVVQRYVLNVAAADNPFVFRAAYDFERSEDRWQIAEARGTETPFWFEPQISEASAHFTIFAPADQADLLPDLMIEAENAYEALQNRGLPLEESYLMVYLDSQETFQTITGQSGRILGLAFSMYSLDSDPIEVTNRAFYLNGELLTDGSQTAEERQDTITHELVHLALAWQTRPFTPPWLLEGAAVYYANQETALRELLLDSASPESLSLPSLTRADSLGRHDFFGNRVGLEYAYSGSLFAYLVETYGEEQALAFYARYAAVPTAEIQEELPRFFANSFAIGASLQNLKSDLTSEFVSEFFGLTLEELEADFEQWLFNS